MFTVVFTQHCSQMLAHGHIQVTLHVNVHDNKLCMDMHGTMDLKKQLTDGCSHSSVHILFTDVGTWLYASGSVVHVYVDKLALCMDMQGTMPLKKQFTDACSQ